MLRFVLGGAGSGKTRWLYADIRRNMDSRRDMVLLTPEQQSHRAERELAAFCGPALSLHGEVLSFTRLYDRVAIQQGGLADPAPDKGGRLLLMALALEKAAPRLRRYGAKNRRTDFLAALLESVQELRDAMVDGDALLEASQRATGPVADKLYDLGLLLEAYDAVSAQLLGDSRDRIRRLAEGIGGATVGAGGYWLDGFTDFTACELEVLDQLLKRGADLTVALTLEEGEAAHFRLTELTFRELSDLAARRGAAMDIVRLDDASRKAEDTAIRYLAENLFEPAAPPLDGGGQGVELCHMESFPGECRWAAGRLLELVREDPGLRYRDFAIAAADFAGGRGTLEAVLGEYGIPYFVEETSGFLEKGLTAFVLSSLAAVNGGWQFRDIFRCLKTGLGGLSVEETDQLENYCLTWSVRGQRQWRQEAPWDMNPRGYQPVLTEADRETLDRVNGLRVRFAVPLGQLADALKEPRPASAQLTALYEYFQAVDLTGSLRARAERLASLGRQAEANECLRLWDVLLGCLEQFYAVLGPVELEGERFQRLLELVFSAVDVGAIPAALDCVAVGGTGRLRGLKPKVLFVLGADDGTLPGSPAAAGLFSAEERRTLLDLGIRLQRDRDEAICRPLHDLYQLAAAPTGRLLISYAGGQDKRPSLLLTQAQALLGVPLQTAAALGDRQLTAAPGPCLRLALTGGSPWADAARACVDPAALSALRRAAQGSREPLRPETVRALYGAPFRLTASRAETFHSCRYLYFMQYGLRARERKQAGFQAPELGTFVHFVLERVCRAAVAGGGFGVLDKEALRALTRRYTDEYTALYLRPGQLQDPRFQYLFGRLCLAVDAIVQDVAGELAASDFRPLDFELRFAADGQLPPVQVGDISLSGAVDRVDGWLDGDTLYLCVSDYKTGRKQFSLTDVWYGLGIQMLVYLFVLAARGGDYYGKKLVPAGVLYAPARDVLLSMPRSATEAEIAAKRAETLRRSGLLLADKRLLTAREKGNEPKYLPIKYRDGEPVKGVATAAQLGALAKYVQRLLEKMGAALRQGQIDANPLCQTRSAGPCDWCPYRSACAFEPGRDRARLETAISEPAFWQAIEQEAAHGGF